MPRSGRIDWQDVQAIQDAQREQDALDALKWLAGEFQRQGLVECAVVLDKAFQDCLRIYVSRQFTQLERQLAQQTGPLN